MKPSTSPSSKNFIRSIKNSSLYIVSIMLIIISSCILYIKEYPFQEYNLRNYILINTILVCILLIISKIHFLFKTNLATSIFIIMISLASTFLIYFYGNQNESDWKLDTHLTLMEIVIALISIIFVILGGFFALKQVKLSQQINKLSAFNKMVEILQSEKARYNRKIIFSLMNTNGIKPLKEWSKEEYYAGINVLADFDLIGLMVKYELLDYNFLEAWWYSMYKCIYILDELKSHNQRLYGCNEGNPYSNPNYYTGITTLINRKNITFDFEQANIDKSHHKNIIK